MLNPEDEDDTIFMPSSNLVAGDPDVGDTVSYDVGPSQGIAYNVKAVVPEPGPLLQRRGQVHDRSNPPAAAAAAAVTTAAEPGDPRRAAVRLSGLTRSDAAAAAAVPLRLPCAPW